MPEPITVVIPTYNRAMVIGRAIESVLKNMLDGDELIVVDDGSTDETRTMVTSYGERIRLVETAHGGAGAARNKGWREARTPLVAFLDSDDEWMPGKLRAQRTLMEARPDLVFSFSDFAVRYESGEEVRRYLSHWHQDPRPWEEILGPGIWYSGISALPRGWTDFGVYIGDLYPSVMGAPYASIWTCLVRRALVGDELGCAEDIPTFEEWEAVAKMARKGPVAYMECETAWQYGHAGERISNVGDLARVQSRITTLKRVWGTDRDFQQHYAKEYARILAEHYLAEAREYLALGRAKEARRSLQEVEGPPVIYRALSLLPGSLVRAAIEVRKWTRQRGRVLL